MLGFRDDAAEQFQDSGVLRIDLSEEMHKLKVA